MTHVTMDPQAVTVERSPERADGSQVDFNNEEALHKSLMRIVLDGQGLEAVAKLMAKRLDRAVAIEDRQFNLLACATGGTGAAERAFDELIANKGTPVALMKQWEEDGTLQTLRKQQRPADAETGGIPRRIYPVVAQGESLGYFTVFEAGALDAAGASAVETATGAVAVELLKQKGAVDSEQKIKRDFFRDLLMAHTPAMAETLRRRATYLGYPLNSAYWVMQIEFDGKKNEDVAPEDLSRLASVVNALLSFRQAIVVNQPQGVTILYPVKDGQPSLDKIQHLAKAILQKAGASGLTHTVSVGVGQCSPELLSVPNAFKEAQHALKIGRHTNGAGGVTFFSELGIYRMLLQFAGSQDPSEFYCDALQRLVEYNQQTDKELVKTIAAFLECNGNLTETSAKLYIHRNTLKYRLERIKDITNIDLDDAENRLMLHLGLKMNQVINYLA